MNATERMWPHPVDLRQSMSHLPKSPHLKMLADEITKDADLPPPPDTDIDEIIQKVILRERVTVTERAWLPHIIFAPEAVSHNPSYYERVLSDRMTTKKMWDRLFSAWTLHYKEGDPVVEAIARILQLNTLRLSDDLQMLTSELRLFSGSLDGERLFQKIIPGGHPEWLDMLGISRPNAISVGDEPALPHVTTDLAQAAIESIATLIGKGRASDAHAGMFFDMIVTDGRVDRSLQVAFMIGLIDAVRGPDSNDALYPQVRNVVEKSFSDVSTDPEDWPGIPDRLGGSAKRRELMDKVRQWNIYERIDIFFTAIAKSIKGSPSEHQFGPRRDFWLEYFQRGVIRDACIALSTDAHNYIQHLKMQGVENVEGLDHARVTGNQKQQRSALIMEVGDAVVLEWSHNGACRVWEGDDKDAPALWNKTYPGAGMAKNYPIHDERNRVVHNKVSSSYKKSWKHKLRNALSRCGNVRNTL